MRAQLFAVLLLILNNAVERSVKKDQIENVSDFVLAFEDFAGQEDGGRDHD